MADLKPKRPMHDNLPAPGAPSAPAKSSPRPQSDRFRISLIKGQHHWHFGWQRGDESMLINYIAQMARDPSVPFDWYDAAAVCKHIAQPFGSASVNQIEI